MAQISLARFAIFSAVILCAPVPVLAVTAEDVKTDVFAALSTPLPITVIGPLLTRDVTVTKEGAGFRATLSDTSLMGLLPFGDVSVKLVPIDDDTYRVTDLQFPQSIDFPGIANITFDGMTLDGVWSAADRSYANLKAEVSNLRVVPGHGDQGTLTLGRLAFDVQKEPDETDTESRFDVTLGEVSFSDAAMNVTVGQAKALLSANGEQPVDLYSVLREVIMVASMGDRDGGLQTLAVTLLGNKYSSVGLDVRVDDIAISNTQVRLPETFEAAGLQAQIKMQDVTPRDWGMAELSVQLDQVEQQGLLSENAFDVARASARLHAAQLPVADLIAAIAKLDATSQTQPVRVTDILDGFMEFGAIELTTQGEALNLEVRETSLKGDKLVEKTAFSTGFESWDARIALEGLIANEGVSTSRLNLKGGSFLPGPDFEEDNLLHVNAWFPKQLSFGTRTSNLNEAFLKQIFQDVYLEDLNEPVELVLPLLLYASASVFEFDIGNNLYETDLFSVEQTGAYRLYPAKLLPLVPVEGQVVTKMTGFDAFAAYIDDVYRQGMLEQDGDRTQLSFLKSAVMVMRNLGARTDEGTVVWDVTKPNVDRPEVTINGTTFHYPEISQLLPLTMLGIY